MKESVYERSGDLQKCVMVESLEDIKRYIEKIEAQERKKDQRLNHLKYSQMWYRGVANASYRLLPKVIRNAKVIADQFGRVVDPDRIRFSDSGDEYVFPNFLRMLDVFKQVVSPDMPDFEGADFDWLYIAQHYGLPTPLLDWTEDIKVALWFATSEATHNSTDRKLRRMNAIEADGTPSIEGDICKDEFSDEFAAVYAMNPFEFNNVGSFKNVDGPVDIDEHYDVMKSYLSVGDRPFAPICLKGKEIDIRLKNQRGNFTVHGANLWPIDYYTVYRKMILKILIPHDLCKEINVFLEELGITRQYIYNGFDPKEYAAKAIEICENDRFERDVVRIKENIKRQEI